MSSSSSDLLAHHQSISAWHLKSRSLDVSCASSYATDDHPTSNTTGANTSMYSKHLNDLQMVPFKWEEAPGKPIITSSCNELISYNPSCLQLSPKLQCQGNQTPLHSLQRSGACRKCPDAKKPTQPCDHGLFRSSPNKPLLKKFSKYMLKTASCTRHAPPFVSHSWNSYPPYIEYTPPNHNYNQQNEILFNDRLFFDRYSPKDLRYCASMDSILPIFDANSAREEECVSRKALSFLAMEEHAEDADCDLSVSSPWKPMSFHYDRRGCASPCWQPSPTGFKVHGKVVREEDEDNDDDDDEGFHDLFSTSSSRKASQRTDGDGLESESSSPSPWYLDFSPRRKRCMWRGGKAAQ
ncbi:hypothetical protein L7F22_065405 [Adiantum nelumboides]|nr:hypothetical protein [Adiantum nelumboides]